VRLSLQHRARKGRENGRMAHLTPDPAPMGVQKDWRTVILLFAHDRAHFVLRRLFSDNYRLPVGLRQWI
jgi:hypothetical protein